MNAEPGRAWGEFPSGEHVVLLDESGAAIGTFDKVQVHDADTRLHLAFSCYVFDDEGRLLLTRRADTKRVFPGVWTNSVCGHPALGESLADAVRRRAQAELGLAIGVPTVVLPEFRYRAQMGGIVENEVCPVLVAGPLAGTEPHPAPEEVGAVVWEPWTSFAEQVLAGEREVSPWCALQVAALYALGADPRAWPAADPARLPPALRPGL